MYSLEQAGEDRPSKEVIESTHIDSTFLLLLPPSFSLPPSLSPTALY